MVTSPGAESHHRRQTSGYVIEAHLHTLKGAERQWQARGSLNNTLSLLLPGPSQEPSAHKKPITTSPEEHRGTRQVEAQTADSEEGTDTLSSPSQGWTRRLSSPGQGVTPIMMSQCCSTSWTEGGHCLEVWGTLRDAGEEHFGIAQNLLWDV